MLEIRKLKFNAFQKNIKTQGKSSVLNQKEKSILLLFIFMKKLNFINKHFFYIIIYQYQYRISSWSCFHGSSFRVTQSLVFTMKYNLVTVLNKNSTCFLFQKLDVELGIFHNLCVDTMYKLPLR